MKEDQDGKVELAEEGDLDEREEDEDVNRSSYRGVSRGETIAR